MFTGLAVEVAEVGVAVCAEAVMLSRRTKEMSASSQALSIDERRIADRRCTWIP
jgi:cytidine deaminase